MVNIPLAPPTKVLINPGVAPVAARAGEGERREREIKRKARSVGITLRG
jgi:hypothetical protein